MSLKRIENTQKGEGRETQMLKSSKRCWESKDNYVYLLINCLPPKEKRRCWKRKGCAEKCDYYFIRRFQKVFKSKGSFWKGNREKYERGDRRRIGVVGDKWWEKLELNASSLQLRGTDPHFDGKAFLRFIVENFKFSTNLLKF